MKNYYYLFIDIGCILIPFLCSFYPKHAFYKKWRAFFSANFIVAFFFIIWDMYFTKIGVWGFNPDYLTGLYLFNLPIEEILFFICIPYACVFTFFSLKYLISKNLFVKSVPLINILLSVLLLILGLFNFEKLYTGTTFILSGLLLIVLKIAKKNLSLHYITYLIILPFFFLSNGILTGSFLDNPIVWYDDVENLGIRIFTIPVEDSIYGLLLIFLNIEFFSLFDKKYNLQLGYG